MWKVLYLALYVEHMRRWKRSNEESIKPRLLFSFMCSVFLRATFIYFIHIFSYFILR